MDMLIEKKFIILIKFILRNCFLLIINICKKYCLVFVLEIFLECIVYCL